MFSTPTPGLGPPKNTTGSAVQSNMMGQVTGTEIALCVGALDTTSLPLVNGNFATNSELRMTGWYFVAPGQ